MPSETCSHQPPPILRRSLRSQLKNGLTSQKTNARVLGSPVEEEEEEQEDYGFRPLKVREPPLPKGEPVVKQSASGTTTSQTLGAISTVAELSQNRVIASQVIRPEVRGFQEPNETPAPEKRTLVSLDVESDRIHQIKLF